MTDYRDARWSSAGTSPSTSCHDPDFLEGEVPTELTGLLLGSFRFEARDSGLQDSFHKAPLRRAA